MVSSAVLTFAMVLQICKPSGMQTESELSMQTESELILFFKF